MIRLGLRLSLRGAREGKVRLALTALGVALAVTLLLCTISGFNALKTRDVRSGWTTTGISNRMPSVNESSSDALWWRISADLYDGAGITIVDVAPTGPRSPLLPGMSVLPAPGEYYVSPALARLLDSTPNDLLGARFPGTRSGILGEELLTSPQSLVMVAGHTPEALQRAGDAVQVRSIESAPREHDITLVLRIALGIGAIGLMLPVMVFVMTATRLAAARREERLAALRLVGATPGQVNVIAAVESVLASVAGTALGYVFFFAFRPLVALIPFTGERFFTQDLALGPVALAGVAIGVPVAALIAGLFTLRRVRISPLGVTRKAPAGRPRAARLLALVAGLLLLLLPKVFDSPGVRTYLIFVVFAGIALGIMIAGPWLTHVGGRLLGAFARKDSTLIAARRLGADSRRAFRAISGLVLAVFMGTVFVTMVATAMNEGSGSFQAHDLPAGAVVQPLDAASDSSPSGEAAAESLAALRSLEGVEAVVPVWRVETTVEASDATAYGRLSADDWLLLGGARSDLAADGYGFVYVENSAHGYLWVDRPAELAAEIGEIANPVDITASGLAQVLVLTDGRQTSVDRVRTALEVSLGATVRPYSIAELDAESASLLNLLGRMIDIGVILCLVIAGCSLAVSVAGGLVERKRAFALLQLAGLPIRRLYRSVLLEAAVPLVLAAVISAAVGMLVAWMIVYTTGGEVAMATPGSGYFAMIGGGLVAALAVVAATLPLVRRMTDPAVARME